MAIDAKTAMMVGTTALEFGAKMGQANALKKEGQIAASIERRNAAAEEQNIADFKASQEFELDLLQVDFETIQSAAETGYAYAGVQIGRGTPVHIFVDNQRKFLTQSQAINYNTNIEINKATVRRDGYLLRALQSQQYYKSRVRAVQFDAFAGVIKGGSDIYKQLKRPPALQTTSESLGMSPQYGFGNASSGIMSSKFNVNPRAKYRRTQSTR